MPAPGGCPPRVDARPSDAERHAVLGHHHFARVPATDLPGEIHPLGLGAYVREHHPPDLR